MTAAAPWLAPLADWVASLDAATLPPATCARVRDAALDWWGALAAGAAHPLAARYRAALAGDGIGDASLAGDTHLRPPVAAAAANAALSHLAEVDDGHRLAIMHPGVTVMPVVFALGETLDLRAADLCAAIVGGYEVGLRVGALLGKAHYAVCHVTATAGCFAAAAAAARLLRLSAAQTLHAFGHAGTQAAGLWQFLDDGAETAKAFHAATAVRNGFTAARLAESGIPGATRILEGPRGLLAAFHLAAAPAILAAPIAPPFQIQTVTIKGWPTCGQMHSCLDAVRDLLTATPVDPSEIVAVRVRGPKAQLDVAGRRDPRTFEEAKFSTAFCVAFLVAEGRLDFANFSAAALERDDVRALAARVAVSEDPAMTARFPADRPAAVEIETADGRVLRAERAFRRGDPEAPWTFPELVERFDAIAATLPGEDRAEIVAWSKRLADGTARQGAALRRLFETMRPHKGETQ